MTNRKNYSSSSELDCVLDDSKFGKLENYSEIKSSLRTRFLEQRQLLSKSEIEERSSKIVTNLTNHSIYSNCSTLALFSPIKSEVDTSLIFKNSIELGRRICFPKVHNDTLRFFQVSDLCELIPGEYGILEPAADINNELKLDDIDLFIIPAICIDKSGNRIGYGGGYYDRALSNVDCSKKVCLVYDFQIIDSIPSEQFDKGVGFIATETGVTKIRRGGN